MKKIIGLLVMAVMFMLGMSIQAQIAPGETDSEAFLSTNFELQETYIRVLCVSQDGSCPAEITTVAPCLISTCTHSQQTYTVSQTFDTIRAASDAAQPGALS